MPNIIVLFLCTFTLLVGKHACIAQLHSNIVSDTKGAHAQGETILVQPAALGGRLSKLPSSMQSEHLSELWHLTLRGLDNSSAKFYGTRDNFLSSSQSAQSTSFFLAKDDFVAGPRFAFLFTGDNTMASNVSKTPLGSHSSLISLELMGEVCKSPKTGSPTSVTYLVKLGETAIHQNNGNVTQGRTACGLGRTLEFEKAMLVIDLVKNGSPENSSTMKTVPSIRDDESAIAASYMRAFRPADDVVGAQGLLFGPLTLWCCPACLIGCPFEIFIPFLWGMVAFKTVCCIL